MTYLLLIAGRVEEDNLYPSFFLWLKFPVTVRRKKSDAIDTIDGRLALNRHDESRFVGAQKVEPFVEMGTRPTTNTLERAQ